MASAIICLATNQKFNFSRYILLILVKNIEAGVPFFMFPRFVQLIINHQLGDMTYYKDIFDTPSVTKKVFTNMKRVAEHNVPLPLPSHDPLPSGEDSLKLKKLMDLYTNLSNKVLDLESKVIDIKSTYKAKIEKLDSRVERLGEENRGRKIAVIDADVEINLEKVQAKAYNLDLDHQEKVLTAKLITEVVTTAGVDVNAASVQDTPITANEATKVIVEVPKPRKRRVNKGIKVPKKEVRQEKEVEVKSSKREGESLEQEIAKKQKMKQETKELKKRLQIIPNDDDDVYADATPLASKVPIVHHKIHTERNKPYFKIIRADGNYGLFMSFSTMMKNFDRKDLESLWKIVRERFEKTKPKNYTDDYFLNTLKIMFEKPNVEANV
nr:hypothetical protein [Tanacetum cinerariifolium]